MEQGVFDHVRDAIESLLGDDHGELHGSSHRRGVKIWFGAADGRLAKEHYEAQLIAHDGGAALEIGFHAEHRDPADNDRVLAGLLDVEPTWRPALGDTAVAGGFLGRDGWTRISEVWAAPDPEDPDAPMEIAARLADYVDAIEPLRQTAPT